MARGRRRIKREQQTAGGRPSIFFITALVIGVLLLLWVFIISLRHPVNEQKRGALHSPTSYSSSEIFQRSPSFVRTT